LSAILQVFTRYSANDPQFPVNDWTLFTGNSHAIGGASRPNLHGPEHLLAPSMQLQHCALGEAEPAAAQHDSGVQFDPPRT